MENKNEVTVIANNEVEVIAIDKIAVKKEIERSFRRFGVKCCESGKDEFAQLASSLVKSFFTWLGSKIQ